MKNLLILVAFLSLSLLSHGQSRYSGTVGSSKVTVSLTFEGDDVFGSYKSKKSGRTYRLEGKNPAQGVAVLKEFTRDTEGGGWVETAIVYLKKSKIKGKIVWSGTMKNHDGRDVKVYWKKTN